MKTLNYKNGIIRLETIANNTVFTKFDEKQLKKVADSAEMNILYEGNINGIDLALIEVTTCYNDTEYQYQRNIFFYRSNVAEGMIAEGADYEISRISEAKFNEYAAQLNL